MLRVIYPVQPDQLFYPSAWGGQKVLWFWRPTYRGPLLIRGRQLDGPNGVRFGHAHVPVREMRARGEDTPSASGWYDWPSTTRLHAPGCYAWQVDGTTFSRVIIFRAVFVSLR